MEFLVDEVLEVGGVGLVVAGEGAEEELLVGSALEEVEQGGGGVLGEEAETGVELVQGLGGRGVVQTHFKLYWIWDEWWGLIDGGEKRVKRKF